MTTLVPLVDDRSAAEKRGDPGARLQTAKVKASRAKRGFVTEGGDIVESPNKMTQAHRDKMFRAKEVFIEYSEQAAMSVVNDMLHGESERTRLEAKKIILERALGKPEAPSEQLQTPKAPVFNIFIGGKPVESIDGIIVDGKIIVEDE